MAAARIRYAPEDLTLPKPWKGLIDGKTGYLYFWNPETNVTQYQRPTTAPAPPSFSSETTPGTEVEEISQGQCDEPHGNSLDEKDGQRNGEAGDTLKEEVSCYESSSDIMVGSHNALDEIVNCGPGGSSIKEPVSCGEGSSMVTITGPRGSSMKEPVSCGAGSSMSAEAYRRQHEITVSGDNVPIPFTSFEATGFPSEILREMRYLLQRGANIVCCAALSEGLVIRNAGFSSPTPIQAQSWPVALQSRDIVAIAKTGSGKTLGYLIPGFLHLKRVQNNTKLGPTLLVLSPTRELATQIQNECVKFGSSSRITCTCLYGGAPKGPQLRDLDKGVDIVVATPGRLNDIIEMRRISLHQVSYLVLDEADRMLDMGFEPQIRKIVNEVPTKRQTLMYTATWPKEVRKIAADLSVSPVQVNIGNVDELVANKSITQHVEVLTYMEKHKRLEQILRSQEPGSKIIIFCSTKKMCDQLANNLNRQYGAAAIHGDKSQSDRDYVLNQFRSGRSPVLVATDVAARGLDVKDIRVVINYDFPTGVEDYVHRIGRTGRGGATGVAYTFFGEKDAKYASDLIKILEGANQQVPPGIRDMASSGGGFGRSRQWSSGSGGRDGGYSGYSQSSYGGRGGRPATGDSRGSDYGSQERFQTKSWNTERSRSRSPDRYGGTAPAKSFHQMMMEKAAQQHAKSQLKESWHKD